MSKNYELAGRILDIVRLHDQVRDGTALVFKIEAELAKTFVPEDEATRWYQAAYPFCTPEALKEALKCQPEGVATEEARLRAIIRQAIWDLGCGKPDLALICLRYAGVEESPLPQHGSPK